jgi:hypothetical protein
MPLLGTLRLIVDSLLRGGAALLTAAADTGQVDAEKLKRASRPG